MGREIGFWKKSGSHIIPVFSGGVDILVRGTSRYINFNDNSGSAGYGIRDNGGTIEIKNSGGAWSIPSTGGGEANIASNLGAGEGIFSAKVGVDLQFKSLVAGSGITLTPSSTGITVASTGGGGGGDALTTDPLSQFAATTKVQLNGVISDGTPMYVGDAPTAHTHTKSEVTDLNAYEVGGTDVSVSDGGTGASTAAGARTALGVDPAGTDNSTPVTVTDTAEIDLTLAGQDIKADIKVGSVDVLKLDAGVQASLGKADTAEQVANKDSANGYAGLDASSKINPAQLPALAISETSVVASEVAQLALTVQEGDIAVRTDENKSYIALNDTNATMADWQELLTPTDQVASVFGRTGTVTAQNGDYTSAQVTEVTDKRYMTDAQETNLDAQSGTNTGDETVASIEALGFDAVGQTSITSSATPAPVGSEVRNEYYLTALAAAAAFANPSGTATNGNSLIVRIKDNATARALTWGTEYRGMADALPTTTTISKTMYIGFRYNSADTKWDMIALNEEA